MDRPGQPRERCEVCGLPALIVAATVGRAWCYWHRTDPQNAYEGSEERQRDLIASVLDQQRALVADLTRQRDGARAVLAPLLNDPYEVDVGWDPPQRGCLFCAAIGALDAPRDDFPHEDDCPVRRKDALLGRVVSGG